MTPHSMYLLATSIGSVTLTPTSIDHIHVDLGDIIVRGVEYRGGAHLYKHRDGAWHVGPEDNPSLRYHSLSLSRRHDFKDPSDVARKTVSTILLDLVENWAPTMAGVTALRAAEENSRQQSIERQQTKITELRGKLAEEEAVLAQLLNKPTED